MIEKMAIRISDYWVRRNVIEPEKKEVLVYGLDILLSSFIITCCVAAISIVMGNIFYIIFYYLCFMPLRGYCGGYHAKTHWGCCLMQCVSFVCTVALGNLLIDYGLYFIIPVFACMFIAVAKLAPVDHPDNPIEKAKKKKLKRMGIITLTAIFNAVIVLNIVGQPIYANIMMVATGVAVISMLAAHCLMPVSRDIMT